MANKEVNLKLSPSEAKALNTFIVSACAYYGEYGERYGWLNTAMEAAGAEEIQSISDALSDT